MRSLFFIFSLVLMSCGSVFAATRAVLDELAEKDLCFKKVITK